MAKRRGAWSSRFAVRGAVRVQAALTALAFVLSSLIGLVHEATTRHVQCAEHGEQVHGEVAAVVAVSAVQLAGGDVAAAVRSQPAPAIHGHEHCLMASATRASRIAPSPPSIATANVGPAAIVVAMPYVAVVRHDPVYRTAPKTSPPA